MEVKGDLSKAMEEEKSYSIIKTEEVEQMLNNRVDKDLNVQRLNHIKKEKVLKDLLERYNRVKQSWGKADSIVKVSGFIILSSHNELHIILLLYMSKINFLIFS